MISIPKAVIDEIHAQAEAERPDEACGYLAGKDERVTLRIEMTNIDHSPEHFAFDPAEQFKAISEARDKRLNLLAVYHSHPETPARMSDEDIRLANDTAMIYIIHSLADGKTKAFGVTAAKQVTDLGMEIV